MQRYKFFGELKELKELKGVKGQYFNLHKQSGTVD